METEIPGLILPPRKDEFGPVDSRAWRLPLEKCVFIDSPEKFNEAIFEISSSGKLGVHVAWNCWIDHRVERSEPAALAVAADSFVFVFSKKLREVLKWLFESDREKFLEKSRIRASIEIVRNFIPDCLFNSVFSVPGVSEIKGRRICLAEAGSLWGDLTKSQIHFLAVSAYKLKI